MINDTLNAHLSFIESLYNFDLEHDQETELNHRPLKIANVS